MHLSETARRQELMKRHIHQYLMQDNQQGLTHQEQYLLNHMIKELHTQSHESSVHAADVK
ncbi:hypothetical protein [Paenibacillus marinisediminis]